jgi:DNA-binding NtrC family response regulator
VTDALRLEPQDAHEAPLPGMVGRHPAMRILYALVRRAAPIDLPVMVVGETGVGKELVARALHTLGRGADRPFVAINCAAVPDHLAEAELFGWDRGVFTGAVRATPGLVETADGGSLFLDEADSLPLSLQAKLLRVIELKEARRIGERRDRHSDFRLIAAVKQPVERLTERGAFRPDFAERVGVITVPIPPLRERGDDLCLLAEHFLTGAARRGHPPKRLTSAALAALATCLWPGNVRQLKTVIERLAVLCDSTEVTARDVLAHVPAGGRGFNDSSAAGELDDERGAMLALLEDVGWDTQAAARRLGWHRATVYRRLHRMRIPLPQNKGRFAPIRANT